MGTTRDDRSAEGEPAVPRLSICIPTYNFGRFIGETLDTIISQSPDDVEIVILDGASTDNTAEIVEGYHRRFPRINYVRRDKKGGIDQDIALAIQHARGLYCWVFSADDYMTPGAVSGILAATRSGDDVYLCETTLCSLDMKPLRRYRNLSLRQEAVFDLSQEGDRRRYFQQALNTQPFFSFCGAVIFNRARWVSSWCEDAFMGSCWALAARLFNMLPGGLRVRHLPVGWSLKRGDNDSFMDKGLVNRIRIGIEGYLKIGKHFFGEGSVELANIRRCLRAEYTLSYMLSAKLKILTNGGRGDVEKLGELFDVIYGDPSASCRVKQAVFHHLPLSIAGRLRRIRWAIRGLLGRSLPDDLR